MDFFSLSLYASLTSVDAGYCHTNLQISHHNFLRSSLAEKRQTGCDETVNGSVDCE